MKYLIEFIVAFLLVFLYQKIFVEKKYKKDLENKKINKTNRRDKTPTELLLFLKMTGLKEKDINVLKVLKVLTFVNAFDIALVLILTEVTNLLILKILVAIISVLIIIVLSYKMLANIYIKKEEK